MTMMEFGFGQGDNNVSSKIERYKGEAGNTDRVSFVWWNASGDGTPDFSPGTPRFIGCKRFYMPGVGYFRDNGPEFAKIAGKKSKLQIATLVAVWPTDKSGALRTRNGKLDAESLRDVVVMPWVFSSDKYDALKRRHNEWPVSEHDINLACTDSQFQKMDFSACRESLYRKFLNSNSGLAKDIVAKIHAQVEALAPELDDIIARDLSLDQIREKLGLTTSGGLGGGAAQSDAEVDGMLDDILED